MSRASLPGLGLALGLALLGCRSAPRPTVIDQAGAVAAGAQAAEAKRYAPQAYARAEALRREAEELAATDVAGAQIRGEQALAAYAQAAALARIARADEAEKAALLGLEGVRAERATLDGEIARLNAEADELERKARIARDALSLPVSGAASADREKARAAAARSLVAEAKMLCGAARLLLPGVPDAAAAARTSAKAEATTALASATELLGKLDKQLEASPAPIDGASRARADCLGALTKLRRAATPVATAPGTGDALQAALSAAGFAPSRDDRGVVVRVSQPFAGDKLTKDAEKKLSDLAAVAKAHPRFPLLVVTHDAKPPAGKELDAQAKRVTAAAAPFGGASSQLATLAAGASRPLHDDKGSQAAANARVEVVFVSPETW